VQDDMRRRPHLSDEHAPTVLHRSSGRTTALTG